MKLLIYVGLLAGSLAGGWIGSILDHGNVFGGWSLLFGTVGALIGIWTGYKAGKHYGI
ncbi:MAG TPA: hypothetical protein VJR27_03760 [Candidatus Saccharimonadales bacterium]|nr:hypothetical protein [Candidatus Saccharimonadales bacterium]